MKINPMIFASAVPFRLPDAWRQKLAASARPLEVRAAGEEAEILVYDQIGEGMFSYGVTAKDFVMRLKDIGDKPVNIRINSPGGDVFEGLAIYNAMKAHGGPVRCTVDGLAASIASIIAMGGKSCSMADQSMMMIHNPFCVTVGDSEELRKTADLLDKVKGQMVDIYVEKSGMGKRECAAMMDEESWLTAKECMDAGLCDEIGNDSKMSANFDLSLFAFKHVPEQLKQEPEPTRAGLGERIMTPDQVRAQEELSVAQIADEQYRERMRLDLI
jgi:ATP-dependent Clp protease protease subunit